MIIILCLFQFNLNKIYVFNVINNIFLSYYYFFGYVPRGVCWPQGVATVGTQTGKQTQPNPRALPKWQTLKYSYLLFCNYTLHKRFFLASGAILNSQEEEKSSETPHFCLQLSNTICQTYSIIFVKKIYSLQNTCRTSLCVLDMWNNLVNEYTNLEIHA